MDNLEYIEAYFDNKLSPEEMKELEQKIVADPVLAEEVAFYLSAKRSIASAGIEQKERFKSLYADYKQSGFDQSNKPSLLRRISPWAAAAAIITAIIIGWYAWLKPVSPSKLADKYVKENFQVLAVTMSNKEDSLQTGFRLYNEGRLEEALRQFESIAVRDTSSFEAKKYAGIVSLRLEQYDKAITHFIQLESYSQLYANPGKFYHALTLMKRDRPGDSNAARQLLQAVVENNMEGKAIAEKWLTKW